MWEDGGGGVAVVEYRVSSDVVGLGGGAYAVVGCRVGGNVGGWGEGYAVVKCRVSSDVGSWGERVSKEPSFYFVCLLPPSYETIF
jgi:hypothetical protein